MVFVIQGLIAWPQHLSRTFSNAERLAHQSASPSKENPLWTSGAGWLALPRMSLGHKKQFLSSGRAPRVLLLSVLISLHHAVCWTSISLWHSIGQSLLRQEKKPSQ